MPSRADDSFLRVKGELSRVNTALCQCPLGLMTHFYVVESCKSMSELDSVSMPSRADDSFLQCGRPYVSTFEYSVSMPSRADDSFLL